LGNFESSFYGIVGYDASSNKIFELSDNQQIIAGWDFDTTSLSAGNITLDSSTPSIKLGSATDYMTGTGIWMGNDSGTYKLHIGNPNDKYLKWDGTDLTITGHFIGTSEIGATSSNSFTINDDADDVTVQLILDRTTGGAATLSWDGAELTSDVTVDVDGSLLQLATKEYVDLAVTSLGASYYMLDTASGISDYKLCSLTPSGDAETYLESADLSDNDYIGGWISASGETPDVLLTGDFNFYLTAEKTTGTKTLKLYWKMYERKSDTSETLIATSSVSNEVDSKDTFVIPLVLTSDYEPDSGSRIVGKLYASVTGSGNAPTVRIYYRGSTGSRWDIPANSEVFRSIFVPYDGAVQDVDLGSYTLTAPTVKLSNLTDGYIPYHVSDASGLANSPIYTNGTDIRIGTAGSLTRALEIIRDDHIAIQLKTTANSKHTEVIFISKAADGSDHWWTIGSPYGTPERFVISPSGMEVGDEFVILESGNVGFRTTTPKANVEIEDGGTSNSVLLKITQDDVNVWGLMIGNDTYSTDDTKGLGFLVADTGNTHIQSTASGDLSIIAKGTVDTSSVRIQAENKIYFQDYNSGSTSTKITMDMQNGRLGIGGTAPYPFYVKSSVDYVAAFESNDAFAGILLTDPNHTFGVATLSDFFIIRDYNTGNDILRIRAGAEANTLKIASSSCVLIGTDTDNAGKLQVLSTSEQLRLEYDNTHYASFTVNSNGTLTLAPTGDFILNPTGNDVYPNTNYDINLGLLTKKFLTLHAAELWVETLVAQNTMATIGGRILVAPTTELTSDLSDTATTIYVKHNNLASGDRVYLESNGKVEFMSIDSAPSGSGPYSYTVTRNLDGSGANQWYAGDAVLNTGTTGDGFIDIYSVRGVKSSSQYGPTIVGNVRNSSTYNDWTEVWAVGNLNGLYGYSSNTYGAAFGKYSAADYITIDPSNGIRFFDSGDVVQAQLSSSVWTLGEVAAAKSNIQITAGTIKLRTNTTSHLELSTAGAFWAGDTSSTERIEWNSSDGLFITDSSNNKVFQADPSGNVNIAGTVDIGVGAFADLPSDENLVGYWSFDDGTGTVAVDGSGNGNDGTLYNMEEADWVDGAVGKALSFDGVDEFVEIDDPVLGEAAITISAWVKKTAYTRYQGIVADYYGGYKNFILGYETPENSVAFYVGDGTSRDSIFITGFTQDEWHHIVGVFDGSAGTLAIYLDGNKQEKNTSITNVGSSQSPYCSIGRYSSYYFNGLIDEVRIYNRALTPSEIKALYLYPAGNRGTRISGNRIRTGIIQSDNYAASAGSMLNLNDGTFKLGGSSTPEFEFDGSNLYVGLQAGEHVKVSSTAVQIKNGATVYTDLTNGVLTLGDSSSGEYILLNGTDGIQMYSGAMQRMRLNIDGSGWFVGANVFSWDTSGNLSVSGNITSASITSSTIDGSIITGGTFRTSSTGKKIIITSDGLVFDTGATTGKYGTFKYGDGTKYGSGALAYIHHSAYDVPFYIASEQSVADFHFYNRASWPSGAAEIGDVAVKSGVLGVCTSAGTPGTWKGFAYDDHNHDSDYASLNHEHTNISDADGDTKIQTEESADEDHIRMDVAGTEAFDLSNNGVLTLAKQARARAYQSGTGQTITSGTDTKVTLNSETYDEQNEFDSSTNYRFTATEAGYYLLIGSVLLASPADNQRLTIMFYKNGTQITNNQTTVAGTPAFSGCNGAEIVYLAASDYVEMWIYQNAGVNKQLHPSSSGTYFAVHKLS